MESSVSAQTYIVTSFGAHLIPICVVASAANFVSEASTQNLRPMLSSIQAFCGLIGVTLGIATGFKRISYVDSGESRIKVSDCHRRLDLISPRQIGSPGDWSLLSSKMIAADAYLSSQLT